MDGETHESCSGRQMVLAPLLHTPPSGTSPTTHPARCWEASACPLLAPHSPDTRGGTARGSALQRGPQGELALANPSGFGPPLISCRVSCPQGHRHQPVQHGLSWRDTDTGHEKQPYPAQLWPGPRGHSPPLACPRISDLKRSHGPCVLPMGALLPWPLPELVLGLRSSGPPCSPPPHPRLPLHSCGWRPCWGQWSALGCGAHLDPTGGCCQGQGRTDKAGLRVKW